MGPKIRGVMWLVRFSVRVGVSIRVCNVAHLISVLTRPFAVVGEMN